MKLFILVHEQDTDVAWGCNVKPFLSKQEAKEAMRKSWEETCETWEYDKRDHRDEDTAECAEDNAIIRDGDDLETWRIEEHDLDVEVAIEVRGGSVQSVYANVPSLYPTVFDFDTDDGDRFEEMEEQEEEFEKLTQTWYDVT